MMRLDRAYRKEDAIAFIQDSFLPEDFVAEESDIYIGNTENKPIKEARSLGYCESLDLKVFEMIHNSDNDPRVSITKQAFEILHAEGASVALVYIISRNNLKKYRFSLIYTDYLFEGNKVQRKNSNPRRYSFLLGEGIPCHTATEYLINRGRVKNIEDLKARFSVEVLTKSFYKELSDWYALALLSDEVIFPNCLTGDIVKDRTNKAQNLIRLITRLLFVWFMKHKDLIPDCIFDEDYLRDNILNNFDPNYSSDNLFGFKSTESIYYKAILQNLFFATLNCPIMDEKTNELKRGFRTPGQHKGVNSLMRYEKFFKNSKAFVDMMNDKVPFLNGALFDCLDDKIANPPIYIDGFSDSMNPGHLVVPDYLFFGEKEEDISTYYGEKHSKTNVYGIIDILRKYNFTVEENTPTDIEVSLDPELLGKVFENLLASYNPETGENARKSTGSFYTPREIVQFMVDESIIAYLHSHTGMTEEELRPLLSYNTITESIDRDKALKIMEAIYNCKILDPACGSGAFPMGILQQLVHILSKLDPDNSFWHKIILKSAEDDSKLTFQSKLSFEEKKDRINDINESFNENVNNPDYSRKLYLIENCIYGVDIQPIAAQISKLRFFISLVVEQNPTKDKKNNFGIRPLPNLDAKFVAANTLLQIKKEEASLFTDPQIEEKQNKQKEACHKLFQAKTARTKKKYEDEINSLRKEIANLLIENRSLGNEDAEMIGKWNMFDQNSSADFFDPEWMFGLNDMFDIVIGNPPYIQLQNDRGALAEMYENCGFTTFARTGDIYSLFYERGLQLLKSSGVLTFITSNKWMRAGYGEKLRKFLGNNNPLRIIDFAGVKVFASATVDTNILVIEKSVNTNSTMACVAKSLTTNGLNNLSDFIHHNSINTSFKASDSWVILNPIEQSIKRKIESVGVPLKDWDISIYRGVLTGCNEAFIISDEKRKEILDNCKNDEEKKRTAELIRPILRGRDIKRYGYDFANLWLIYIPWHFPLQFDSSIQGASKEAEIKFKEQYPTIYSHLLSYKEKLAARNKAETGIRYEWYALQRWGANYWDDFYEQKIVFQEMVQEPAFCLDNDIHFFCLDTGRIIIGKKLEYLLCLLNSKVFFFAIKHFYGGGGLGESGVRMKHTFFQHFHAYIPTEEEEFYLKSKITLPISYDTSDDIDKFFYRKYGLEDEEIKLIESDVICL